MTRTRTGRARRPAPRPSYAPLVGVLLLVVLTGCGPGASEQTSDSGSSGTAAEPATGDASSSEQAGGGGRTTSLVGDAATPALQRAVVSTGELRVETRAVERARDEVLQRARGWGGLVADEQTSSDERGRPLTSAMVLRVPTPRFAAALESLADLGRVTEQTRSSEDVTTQVVDNAARVRAAQSSIRSIERLLSRAERLGDVIRIESDLARRQADLDSLTSQQAYLADQTSLSTITLHLERPVADAGPQEETQGFLAGLRQGWDALAGSGLALVTVLGAVLPFAALLALVGVPLALVLRRRRSRPAPAAPAAPSAG